jgi:NAD(P)-dependent dehydrogenase (short-subunit alcohol dehydrogenase family)
VGGEERASSRIRQELVEGFGSHVARSLDVKSRESSLRGKVIVITGASSGLGRAAAVEFARRGCRVVLGARREDALEETAQRCRDEGAEAIVVETDVTVEAEVRALADRALELSGRIDAWVNNAGVTAFGALEDGPFDVHRRVIETNVFGSMYGARAAIPIFKRQGAGVLVNVSSVLGKVGQPYVPSYVVSKFAVRGLSETLRTALADHPDVHVCTLLPYAFESPHFESGANRVGLDAHPMPPTQSPDKVARALVSLVERPRHQLYVPGYARLGVALHTLVPAPVERAILHIVREWHFGFAPERRKPGNLFAPTPNDDGAKTTHGTRRARTSLPGMLAWAVAHFARIPRSAPLRPHSAS